MVRVGALLRGPLVPATGRVGLARPPLDLLPQVLAGRPSLPHHGGRRCASLPRGANGTGATAKALVAAPIRPVGATDTATAIRRVRRPSGEVAPTEKTALTGRTGTRGAPVGFALTHVLRPQGTVVQSPSQGGPVTQLVR